MGNRDFFVCLLIFAAGAIWSPLFIDGYANPASTINSISEIATTVGVGFAIYVGLSGLNAWHKQMAYGQNHELAKRSLVALEKVKSGFKNVRNPLVIPEPIESKKELSFWESHNLGVIKAYENRWQSFEASYQELEACGVEAKILWGDSLQKKLVDLRKLKTKLFITTQNHATSLHPSLSPLTRDNLQVKVEQERDILYDLGEEDPFSKEIDRASQEIEAYLQKYLVRIH